MLKALLVDQVSQQPAKIAVVRSLLEIKTAAVKVEQRKLNCRSVKRSLTWEPF